MDFQIEFSAQLSQHTYLNTVQNSHLDEIHNVQVKIVGDGFIQRIKSTKMRFKGHNVAKSVGQQKIESQEAEEKIQLKTNKNRV